MVKEYLPEILAFLGGNLVALAASYITVGHKLSFVQGQLAQILRLEKKVETHADQLGRHKEILHKHGVDLGNAFAKIREITKSRAPHPVNGSDHG